MLDNVLYFRHDQFVHSRSWLSPEIMSFNGPRFPTTGICARPTHQITHLEAGQLCLLNGYPPRDYLNLRDHRPQIAGRCDFWQYPHVHLLNGLGATKVIQFTKLHLIILIDCRIQYDLHLHTVHSSCRGSHEAAEGIHKPSRKAIVRGKPFSERNPSFLFFFDYIQR